MVVLVIIAVIALSGYAYGFIKAREMSALRKEMKLYMDQRSWTYTQSEA